MKITITKESATVCNGTFHNRNAKPIFCVTTGVIYASGQDMANELNLSPSEISKCCNGSINNVKGYKMCFVKNSLEHIEEISQAIYSKEIELSKYRKAEAREKEISALKTQLSDIDKKRNDIADRLKALGA